MRLIGVRLNASPRAAQTAALESGDEWEHRRFRFSSDIPRKITEESWTLVGRTIRLPRVAICSFNGLHARVVGDSRQIPDPFKQGRA